MNAKSIDFGRELRENFLLRETLPKELEGQLIEYVVNNGVLSFTHQNKTYEVNNDTKTKRKIIDELKVNEKTALVRVESIKKKNVLVTIYVLSNKVEYIGNEHLNIVINKDVERKFRKDQIGKDIKKFFYSKFMINDMCFALMGNAMHEEFTLLGEKHICRVKLDKQKIMHVVDFRRKSHSVKNSSVTILCGNISFEDRLTNDSQLTKETERKYEESIKDTESVMKIWSLYNDLDLELTEQEIEKMGSVDYISYTRTMNETSNEQVEFVLSNSITKSFVESGLGYSASSDDVIKDIYIGDKASLSRDGMTLTINKANDLADYPKKGTIVRSSNGTYVSVKRRKMAQDKVMRSETPMVGLKLILQDGQGQERTIKEEKPVTSELVKKIFGTKDLNFTERQRQAINIAINTPDISLIQGPPGTGKTTIIRAIIARLNMIYKGDIRILVSSAQHDAVDNAIENVEYGGIPANRMGGKFQSDDKNKAMYRWVDDIVEKCDDILTGDEAFHLRNNFRVIYDGIYECRRTDDLEFIREKLNVIHQSLIEQSCDPMIIKEVGLLMNREKDEPVVDEIPSYLTRLEEILNNQKTDVEFFIEDRGRSLGRLIQTIEFYNELDYSVPEHWKTLRYMTTPDEALEKLLNRFKMDLIALRNDVFKEPETINEDSFSNDLESTFEKIIDYMTAIDDEENSVSNCIFEFRNELNNPKKVNSLINAYAKINAATCQQSVPKIGERHESIPENGYDYVIIDEAARANPLDLIIPLSLAKKIILVGDHAQLPHFLEPNIVDAVLARRSDPSAKALLEDSLFSRVFGLVKSSKTDTIKTIMLKEQYRMHPMIAKLVSDNFYDSKLESLDGEVDKLHNLGLYNNKPLAWLDIPMSKGVEDNKSSKSISRKEEVDTVIEELNKIIEVNKSYSIGVISFYGRQTELIKKGIKNFSEKNKRRISIGTVDSFQGKEFDVVILTMVRSNKWKNHGFITSRSRLNVSFSRAKRLLICVGDAKTVAYDDRELIPELSNMLKTCKEDGYYEQR